MTSKFQAVTEKKRILKILRDLKTHVFKQLIKDQKNVYFSHIIKAEYEVKNYEKLLID